MRIQAKIVNPLLNEFGGLPRRASEGAAGFDLVACIEEEITLAPGESKVIPSGLAVHIGDPSVAAIVLPRSGLGIKKGVVLSNLVGLIDSDYQGEIKLGLWNRNPVGGGQENDGTVVIKPGDRVAQLVFIPVVLPELILTEEFDSETVRGEGGLGSTGVSL